MNTVPNGVCDYLYGRDVDRTGKFCAGGTVDACQVAVFFLSINANASKSYFAKFDGSILGKIMANQLNQN